MRYVPLSIITVLLLFIVFSMLWAAADYMSIDKEPVITYTGAAKMTDYEYAQNRTTLSEIYEEYRQEQKEKDNYEQIRVETARTRGENIRIVSGSS